MADGTKIWLPEPGSRGQYTYPDGAEIDEISRTDHGRESDFMVRLSTGAVALAGDGDALRFWSAKAAAEYLASVGEGPAAADHGTVSIAVTFTVKLTKGLTDAELAACRIEFGVSGPVATVPGVGRVGRVVGHTGTTIERAGGAR